MQKLKVIFILFLVMFLWIVPVNSVTVDLGEFAIGEAFVDEYISYSDGSRAKVSIIYRGSSGNGLLLHIASFPETSYVIAPGYCLIEKTTTAKYWTFLFGFGVEGDRIYQLQKNSNNQIKVWRIQ